MMKETILVFLLGVAQSGWAYNIDIESAVVWKGPRNGLFGHSVALTQSNIYVGAPKNELHGDVFKCSKSSTNCQTPISHALTLTWGKPGGRMYVNWKEPFFGATVSVNSDGRVTSCAHREPLNNREFCLGSKCKELLDLNFGRCYESNSGNTFKELLHFFPAKEPSSVLRVEGSEKWDKLGLMGPYNTLTKSGKLVFNAPYATLGWKKDDDEKSRLVGTIVQEKSERSGDKMTVATGNWQKQFVPHKGVSFKEDPHVNDDTGNAIVQGNFFPDHKGSQHFAVGAPGANRLRGRVYICFKCFEAKYSNKMDQIVELPNKWEQTGAKFGAALAAVNINGDLIDDLVVGAPLYSDDVDSVGRIFIFKAIKAQNGKTKFGSPHMIKPPYQVSTLGSSRFGFAIANLGSIDGDRFEDFAVGAPGLDNTGAVFIYHGAHNFRPGQPQKLSAEAPNAQLPKGGLGYSLSKEQIDFDQNDFKDIAVGAPFADTAVLFKSKRVLRFKPKFVIKTINPIDPTSNEFELPISLGSSSITPASSDVRVLISVTVQDERVTLVGKDKDREEIIKGQPSQEHKLHFKLNKDKIDETDELKPITISVSLALEVNCNPGLSCPVLHELIKTKYQWQSKVEFFSGCDIKDKCKCDLYPKLIQNSLESKTIIVDEDTNLVLTFEVPNNGTEPGYGAKIQFKSNVDLMLPNSCVKSENIQGVECGLKKIKVNQQEPAKYEYKFRLPGQKFENKSKLEITPSLVSQCNGEPKTQSLTQISYDLDFKSDIKVIVPSPSDERFDDTSPIAETHKFELQNHGPSYTNTKKILRVYLPKFVPLKTNITSKDGRCVMKSDFTLPKDNPKPIEELEQFFCNSKQTCAVYDCEISKGWKVGEKKEFTIKFNMQGSEVPEHFQISSIAEIVGEQGTYIVTTTLDSGELGAIERLMQSWPIVLGIGLSIILSLGTVVILWKTGVLAKMRPYKLDEEDIREERRRATMVRMSKVEQNVEETQKLSVI